MSQALPHSLLVNCQPNAVRLIRQGWHALARLPFRYIWLVDGEFMTNGNPHRPWCVGGYEVRSGAHFEWWTDGERRPPPFQAGTDTLVISFVIGAEACCWRQLGWPMPVHFLDLFQEARRITNTG